MSEFSKFSIRLKDARILAGMKQETLADMVGITVQTLSRYENIVDQNGNDNQNDDEKSDIVTPPSKKYPTLEVALRLAKSLNVSLDWLSGLTDRRCATKLNATDYIHLIAELIDNAGSWKTTTDVVEERDDNNGGLVYEERYYAAICTKDIRFSNFINEYKQAVLASRNAMTKYGLSSEIASSMQERTIQNYTKALEYEGGAE